MVEYSFTAVAVMLASQDIAVPEPGVCIDDFRCLRKPVHRPCWTTALICFCELRSRSTPRKRLRRIHVIYMRVPGFRSCRSFRVERSCFSGPFMLSRERVDKIGSIHNSRGIEMEYDKDKVDAMVLALMYLGMFSERSVRRAWKSFAKSRRRN